MTERRCIWITADEYLDWKKGLGTWALDAERLLNEKWDAAPADPVEAVKGPIELITQWRDPWDYVDEAVSDVLNALGWEKP